MATAPSIRGTPVTASSGSGAPALTTSSFTITGAAVDDYAIFTVDFGTSDAISISASGWTLVSNITSTGIAVSFAVFIKKLVAADLGSSFTASVPTTAGRWAASLTLVKNAATYTQALPADISALATTFSTTAFTPTSNDAFALQTGGVRWAATTSTLDIPAVGTWTEVLDVQTSNTTGQRIGTWQGSKTLATSNGVAQPSDSTTTAQQVRHAVIAFVFNPINTSFSGSPAFAGSGLLSLPNGVLAIAKAAALAGAGTFAALPPSTNRSVALSSIGSLSALGKNTLFTKPKGYATGFSTRRTDQIGTANVMAVVETLVVDWRHWDMWPDSIPQDPANPTASANFVQQIHDAINYAKTNVSPASPTGAKYKVVLRMRVGWFMADWAKTASGGALVYGTDDGWGSTDLQPFKGDEMPSTHSRTDPDDRGYYFTKGAARWWDSRYGDILDKAYAFIAAEFCSSDPNDNVVEVDIGYAATQFVEPLNHQFNLQENRDAAAQAGYTEQAEDEMFRRSWVKAMEIFAPLGVGIATSYNPAPTVVVGSSTLTYDPGTNINRTYRLMDQQKQICGLFGLTQNKSFDADYIGGNRNQDTDDSGTQLPVGRIRNQGAYERQMWDRMAGMRTQCPEQTATLAKMKAAGLTVKDTVEALVSFKGMRMELPDGIYAQAGNDPTGVNYISPAYAAANSQRITYHPERETNGPILRGVFSGGSDSGSSTVFTATLPSGITSGSTLVFSSAVGTNNTVSSITIDGVAVTPTVLASSPVTNGTNFPAYLWALQGSAAYSGKQMAITWTPTNARGGIVGEVWSNLDITQVAATNAIFTAAGSGPMPAVTNRGGITIEFAWSRLSTAVATVGMPAAYPADVSYSTSAGSGYGLSASAGSGAGAGGGTVSTSPVADKMILFSTSFAASGTATGFTAYAGADATYRAFDIVPLIGTQTNGTAPFTQRKWTQLSGAATVVTGTGSNQAFIAPGTLNGDTQVWQYSVQDATGTVSTDTVSYTIQPVQWRAIIGGTQVPSKYIPINQVASSTLFYNVFPGGGGQSASAASPFSKDVVALGTDTGGVRVSTDGTLNSYINTLGWDQLRSKQSDGLVWSTLDSGRLFMTCGDGTANPGGVFVMTGADTGSPTAWMRLDGQNGAPKLLFNGGNGLANTDDYPSSGSYPRHYGTIIEIDEVTSPGFTYLHVAAVPNYVTDPADSTGTHLIPQAGTGGAWRLKIDNSSIVAGSPICVEQIQYQGTDGEFIRSIKMATYSPNAGQNNYSRIIINNYSRANPVKPLLCTNANDTSASPVLATTVITSAPNNTENIGYIKTATGQPVTIFVANKTVRFSTNAFTAAANAITMTEVARTAAQNDGPENDEQWISVGTNNNGSTYIVLVGTHEGGRKINLTTFNTVWRGTWDGSSTTPATAVTWAAISGTAHWSENILNNPLKLWWLAGVNTPGISGTSNVSAFTFSPADQSRMYATCRGNSYISDDYGVTWYESRTFGSANHFSMAFDWYVNKNYMVSNSGDWPLISMTEPLTSKLFVNEGLNVMHVDTMAGSDSWFDPRTGELMWGVSLAGGHEVPARHASNSVFLLKMATPGGDYPELKKSYSSAASGGTPASADAYTDLKLFTGDATAGAARAGVVAGICVYGSNTTAPRAVMVGTKNAGGLWYTANDGTGWAQITAAAGGAAPYKTGDASISRSQFMWDPTRNVVYTMDRQGQTVWRMSIDPATSAISSATRIFGDTWNYGGTSPDSAGYIDLDVANNRLWISTLNGVWYIASASTATESATKTNATASGLNALLSGSGDYAGELIGPMCFRPKDGRIFVVTLGFTSNQKQIYPKNGASGPRALLVSTPTSAGSWGKTAVIDWASQRDPKYRTGYTQPHGIARNWDGSIITLSMQGNGVGAWSD